MRMGAGTPSSLNITRRKLKPAAVYHLQQSGAIRANSGKGIIEQIRCDLSWIMVNIEQIWCDSYRDPGFI
ncbi:hypothetical protein Hanom_Chr16g01451111 [Helianthus anomalus]